MRDAAAEVVGPRAKQCYTRAPSPERPQVPVLSPIQFIVSWAHRRRGLVMCASLVLVLLSGFGLRRLSFDADVLSLLPRDGEATPAFRTFLQRFGSLDQLFVVFTAPEGRAVADYADDVERWIADLRAVPEIEWVDPGTAGPDRDWAWLAEHQLLLLRGASLDTALARLQPEGMAGALASSRELLTMPSPAVAAMVRQDPLDLLGLLRAQLGGSARASRPASRKGDTSAPMAAAGSSSRSRAGLLSTPAFPISCWTGWRRCGRPDPPLPARTTTSRRRPSRSGSRAGTASRSKLKPSSSARAS